MDDTTGSQPDADFDIESILSADTSGTMPETGAQTGSTGDTQGGTQGVSQGFKFGGRNYKSQQEAEKSHNTLYGKYSEQGGTLNLVKKALSSPEAMKALQGQEGMEELLGKLGIQQAQGEAEAEGGEEGPEIPEQFQRAFDEIKTAQASFDLDREMWSFEKSLKRDLKPEEDRAVRDIIHRAPSLSYAEAFRLAHHSQLMKEAVDKAQKSAQPQKGGRPSPKNPIMPGMKLDMKKGITDMNKQEAREHLRGIVREHGG